MASIPEARISPAEYLRLERVSETKREFVDGLVYAMAGASLSHNRICSNLSAEVVQRLKGGPCESFSNDLRVRTPDSRLYSYPDLVIVCGKPETEDEQLDTLLNPIVIIEVLSSSTEAWDRGKKFARYQTIPGLREYILVWQDEPRAESFVRHPDTWNLRIFQGLDAELKFDSVNVAVPLRDIYARVEFPAESEQ